MSTTPEQANTIAQFLIANLRDEYKLTRRVLESVPADQLEYAPAGKCMCGGALAAHIAGAEVMFLQTIITSTFSGPPAEAADLKTPEQIVAYYDQIPGLLDQAA